MVYLLSVKDNASFSDRWQILPLSSILIREVVIFGLISTHIFSKESLVISYFVREFTRVHRPTLLAGYSAVTKHFYTINGVYFFSLFLCLEYVFLDQV